ncbi:MAG: HYR domain-containing protein [Planctomycetes bacterium]|nr:HYR domain-containing protein [Planctomycetota bacterium]
MFRLLLTTLLLAFIATATSTAQTLEWARADGGYWGQSIFQVEAFSDASLAVLGNYNGDATWGIGDPSEFTSPWWGNNNFISRYNSDGTFRWSVAATSTRGEKLIEYSKVSASPDDATYYSGSHVTWRPHRFLQPDGQTVWVPTGAGERTGWVVRFNGVGQVDWSRAFFSANGFVQVHDVAALSDGSVAVFGLFRNSVDFGDGTWMTPSPVSTKLNAFLLRLAPDGTLIWARQVEGTGYAYDRERRQSGQLDVGPDDSIVISAPFITGGGEFTPSFDGLSLVDPAGGNDTPARYIAKYSPTGDVNWAVVAMNHVGERINDLEILPDGSIVYCGNLGLSIYGYNATFGPGTPNESTPSSYAWSTPIVALWNTAGDFQWVTKFVPHKGDAGVLGVAANDDGSIAVVGSLFHPLNIGTITIERGHNGSRTVPFAALLDGNGDAIWAAAQTTPGLGYDSVARAVTPTRDGAFVSGGTFQSQTMTVSGTDRSVALSAVNFNPEIFLAKWKTAGVAIGVPSDIIRHCDDGAEDATVNFIVSLTGTSPDNTIVVTDLTNNRILLSSAASDGDFGIGPFLFPNGPNTVEVSVQDSLDAVLSSSTFQVVIEDNLPPTLHGVADMTIECSGETTTLMRSMLGISASDHCDPNPQINFNPSALTLGTTPVNVTAVDETGNTITMPMQITVVDTRPPTFLQFPENILRECESTDGTNISFSVTAGNECGEVVIYCVDQDGNSINPAGTIFEHGMYTITCTAIDQSGNSISDSFFINVEDTTAPTIVMPQDITIGNDPTLCTAAVPFLIQATDLCDEDFALLVQDSLGNDVQSGDSFPLGTTAITVTATDVFGNQAQGYFNITVLDEEAPVIEGLSNIDVVTDCIGSEITVNESILGLSITDNCGEIPVITVSPSTLQPGVTAVTISATDNAGNVETFTTSVTTWKGEFDVTVLRPLDPLVDNKIKAGRVVPVKVEVSCENTFASDVTATIDSIVQVSAAGTPITNELAEDAGTANDDGNVMRLASGHFIYNLDTSGWNSTSGTRFCVTVRIQEMGHVDTTYSFYLINR